MDGGPLLNTMRSAIDIHVYTIATIIREQSGNIVTSRLNRSKERERVGWGGVGESERLPTFLNKEGTKSRTSRQPDQKKRQHGGTHWHSDDVFKCQSGSLLWLRPTR